MVEPTTVICGKHRLISTCQHVISGEKPPIRIICMDSPTAEECDFRVTCGNAVEETWVEIGTEPFLHAHPEFRDLMANMRVGDEYLWQETKDGFKWVLATANY